MLSNDLLNSITLKRCFTFALVFFIFQNSRSQSIYNGGSGGGLSVTCYNQTSNSLLDIFYGGSQDGYSSSCFTQSDNIALNIYSGGIEDGASSSCYTQPDNILFDIYKGGDDDGFAFTCFTQPDNILFDIYKGGSEDGFAFTCYTQPDNILFDIYKGGSEDGFSFTCYTQPDNPFFDLYHGGSADGFAKSCASPTGSVIALPIELIDFTAVPFHSNVKVNWVTASETNNDFFTVERSTDGMNFETVTQVDSRAPGGNSNTELDYQIFDESPYKGWSYYRLKQTDFDGHVTHSNIVAVNLNDPSVISIYPNPIEESEINVYGLPFNERLNIKLMNTLGETIMSEQFISDLNGKLKFSVSSYQLSMGVYLIEIISSQQHFSGKLIIQ